MERKIAIITARGGSKRIPKKNIKEFCGKPIIAYSIEAAIESRIFDTVMVSTDSQEIAKISEDFGAEIPFFRSRMNSNDYSTTADVLEEVLLEYRKKSEEFTLAACLYPTAPFITSEKLVSAMKMLNKDVDSVIPVVSFSFPPQRAFIKKGQYVSFAYPEYERVRSQDVEPMYHDCGQFCIFNVRRFLECKSLIMPRTIPYMTSELEVQDIDNESDWKIAELKYQLMNESKKI